MTEPSAGAGRPPLHARLGVEPGAPRGELQARLDETAIATHQRLESWGQLREGAPIPRLSPPAAMGEVLALGLAEARRAGPQDHAELLALHYLEALPSVRVGQLAGAGEPHGWLFHGPLPWGRLPRFEGALDRLFALLACWDVDATAALGFPTGDALKAASPTLASLYERAYFGQLQPMFQALPHDLVLLAAEAESAADPWAAVDHRLGGAILHELLHFAPERDAIYPPYLDEAIAGYLGVHLDRPTGFAAPGDDNALVGWPWFAQVGQALARAFGMGAVLRAHAGVEPWERALPGALVAAAERLAWRAYRAAPQLHFHPDTTRPERWARLFYAAARGVDVSAVTFADLDAMGPGDWALPPDAERDREIVAHALAAMCLVNTHRGGSWRVRSEPPPGPVMLDFSVGLCTAPPHPDGIAAAPPRHVLPPLDRSDRVELVLDDVSEDALARLAERVLDG